MIKINKLILDQLLKCKIATLNIDDNNPCIINIPKHEELTLSIGECFIVELDDSLLTYNENDLIACNWNQGNIPKCKYLKVSIIKVLGKLIYVNAIGYDIENKIDLDYVWNGWLQTQKINLLYKL